MDELEFRDLNYWVPQLHILKGIYGRIRAGRFTAILGSSGSGKSSLLDLLALKKTEGGWSGQILYNGQEIFEAEWRRQCGYVMQNDRLLGCATVFESLMFSSQLRTNSRGQGTSYHEKKVDAILEELSLSHRKHSRIGYEGKKVLSGGEIRRVSIGLEFVAECKVMFLDEPTSGLDSSTARNLIETIVNIAKKGRVVAATLHQPSSSINSFFDDLILLANGKVCYSGPYSDLFEHFEAMGFTMPLYMNPTDYIMDLSHDDDSTDTMVKHMREKYPLIYNTNDSKSSPEDEDYDNENSNITTNYFSNTKVGGTSFAFEFCILWLRSFRQFYRDPVLLASESLQYIVFGVFIGFMYFKFPSTCIPGTFDRESAIFLILTTICFIPSYTVVTTTAEERPLTKRELSGGIYSLKASFFSKMCVSWPFELAQTLILSTLVYWICGFQDDVGKFTIFFLILCVFVLISETIGLISAVATSSATMGVLVLSLILLFCLSLGGFLVFNQKPAFIWFENINFFVYAIGAIQVNEFSGLVLFEPNSTTPCSDGVDLATVLRQNGRIRNNLSIGESASVLIGMLVILRFTAYCITYWTYLKRPIKKSNEVPSTVSSLMAEIPRNVLLGENTQSSTGSNDCSEV